jgi:N-acetylglucosaminyl-diphospho-decaprenol L-rhamnosyltransferase
MLNTDITIVINTFNSDEQIFLCLDSINPKYKILIIENSNNSKFKENIEKKYLNVKCYLTGENLGYAKGNNFGLSKVKSKFALILNPDTLLKENSIDNFFNSVKKYPNFAIIAPAIQEQKDIENNKYIGMKDLIEVDSVKGFGMFLNISQFNEIGFFDDNFFIYFEEIDLCKRLRNKNKYIYLDPSILIDHIGGSSHNASINFEMELSRNWHWMWSTFYFHKKYNGFIIALLKISRKLCSALIKVLIYTLMFNQKKKKIYYHRLSGLFNSIIGNKSWYRPKIF